MNTSLKSQIIKLREEGLSYSKIQDTLGCSKGTISYHLEDKDDRGRTNLKRSEYKKSKGSLSNKISKFQSISGKERHKLFTKVNRFHSDTGKNYKGLSSERTFSPKELIDRFQNICYLTGREVDLNNSSSYELDHITPRIKGGESNLENCGLTCRDANRAKADMTLEEFFQLCKEVVIHNNLI